MQTTSSATTIITDTESSLNSLPNDEILDRSKLKQSADNNFKFDENSRKFSKQVENTVGKGEIACYKLANGLFPRGVKRCHCAGMG